MKFRLVLLATFAMAFALSGAAKTERFVFPVFKLEFPPVQIATPVTAQPAFDEVRFWPPARRHGPFMCGCMFGRGLGFVGISDFRRETLLPDPVATIGSAYLQSRSVKAALLDPGVHVDTYPAGRFGSWVQDGVLVTERIEITAEPELRQVFTLLVEAIEGPDEAFDYWVDEPSSGTSLADYRRNTGFVPEVSFEFVGGAPLRAELNLKQGRMLLQAGERWEVYTLDRWSGVALGKLLTARPRS